jgi:hypothetical protein
MTKKGPKFTPRRELKREKERLAAKRNKGNLYTPLFEYFAYIQSLI